jgi:hypothetical protein
MKRAIGFVGRWVAVCATTIVAACGGGSSSSSMGSPATPSAMVASGVITGFNGAGGVTVNGQKFATGTSTQVLDGDNDDAPSSASGLQVGMTVDIDASGSAATMLRFISAVRGEVDAVDPTGSTLTVLGQTVQVGSGTSFAGHAGNNSASPAPMRLSDIHAGDYVVVFGYVECPGTSCTAAPTDVVATLVVEPASVGMYRVQGYVTNYNAGTNSFMINGLTVDIATSGMSPTVCSTMNCAFANGDFVVVRSATAPTGSAAAGTLTLTASEVRIRPQTPTFAMGATVTIEGPVTNLSATGFTVRGITVDASASGLASTLAGLQNNQIVEVTGTIAAGGTLTATSITVEQSATFVLTGPLDSVSATGFSVLGQSFSVTGSTIFADLAQGVRPLDSTNFATVLGAGNQVIVAGYPSSGGNVATRVVRIATPATPTAAVEGVVTADDPSSDTMTVAGVNVALSSSTLLLYFTQGAAPTLTGFFAAITPNSSIGAAFGTPGSSPGTINAMDAAVLQPSAHWDVF